MFKEFTALQIVCLLPFSVVLCFLPSPFDNLIYIDLSVKIYGVFITCRQHRREMKQNRERLEQNRERLEQLLKEIRQAPAFTSNPN